MGAREREGAIIFTVVLLVYLLTEYVTSLFTSYRLIGLVLKFVFITALLLHYRHWFKFEFKFDTLSMVIGLAIGIIWIASDNLYPHLAPTQLYVYDFYEVIFKLLVGIVLAPIVEEFFTRFFLHRLIAKNDWLGVPIGAYSLAPFIVTTLFFGFSHNMWLAGLITGVLLNWLWYVKKDMNSVVLAHGFANLVIGFIVVLYGLWTFW